MYCGSCLNDNALAAALIRDGVDIQLIPLYTPIRTDGEDVSIDRVFFGGVNVYLQQKLPLFRYLPRALDRMLDHPGLIRWITRSSMTTSAKQLGELTVSMLQGRAGHQRKEVDRFVSWMEHTGPPDLIQLTNILVAGCVPALKERFGVPTLVTLQGDDVFLDDLVSPYRERALDLIERLGASVDGFLTHSQYYADYIADYLSLPRDRFHTIPLGVPADDFAATNSPDHTDCGPRTTRQRPPTVGYLARLAPEKGLHVLAEGFEKLRCRPGMEQARLLIAGWMGRDQQPYADQVFQRMSKNLDPLAYEYVGEVSREQKVKFLRDIDVLSVPTVYREPKGMYVLEALAAGVPVVQPRHGAFPEIIERFGGGLLFDPQDTEQLALQLHRILSDDQLHKKLASQGQSAIRQLGDVSDMARAVSDVYAHFLGR